MTTTAARLLSPRGGKVVAFTGVPRAGYDGPTLRNSFNDESQLAAATAAMYPNIEHVLIRTAHQSPLDELDRAFYLEAQPSLGVIGAAWSSGINRAARERKLTVMLDGPRGNLTISYSGAELLTELLVAGRFIKLWHEANHFVEKTNSSWGGALINTFGPFLPVWLWRWLQRRSNRLLNRLDYSAIRTDCLAERDIPATARERGLDFAVRGWKDGFARRLWALRRSEGGAFCKRTLAEWGLDLRAPLADKRLIEFCLSIPTDEYLCDGIPRSLARRALADRMLPVVLNEHRRGNELADWHEVVTGARAEIAAELDRVAAHAPAAKMLDIDKMKSLVVNWPTAGWERGDIAARYEYALIGGIAAGHFLRKTSGAN